MKKLILLLLVISLAGCSNKPETQVTIEGKIENSAERSLEVLYFKDFVVNETVNQKTELKEDNTFSLKIPLEEAEFAFLTIGRRSVPLYLKPGANINIIMDAAQEDEVPEISGEMAAESSYLVNYLMKISKNNSPSVISAKAKELDAHGFIMFSNELYNKKNDFLKNYELYEQLDEDFVLALQKNYEFEKNTMLLDYPSNYMRHHSKEADLPEDYYQFLDNGNVFDDEAVKSRSYLNFVSSYMTKNMREGYSPEDERSYYHVQYDVARDIFEGKTRELMLSKIMVSILNFVDFDKAMELYNDYSSLTQGSEYFEIVSGEYEKVVALAPGKPAPDFTLTDINGNQVSLGDFKGKVIYLDFWASWCGPCMREMPHAKELKKRMAGYDDIVYLYVSVDTDEGAWRKTVEEHEITGVHANVAGFDHEVPSLYNLKGVPTFYLIGRDGNIIDNRPPRPSNQLIDQTLLEALEI